jgi:hypothetical protein
MIFVMFTIGKIMNNRTRIIDIINTVFIAQIPLVIIVPLNKVPFVEDTLKTVSKIDPSTTQSLPIADLIFLSVYGFITILFLVYSFALIYNGFKTATNCKKWQQVVLFCFIVFLTISVSQIIL